MKNNNYKELLAEWKKGEEEAERKRAAEEEKLAREKMKKDAIVQSKTRAEAEKKEKETASMAKKKADEAAREQAKSRAEAEKKVRESIMLTRQEAEKAAKEKARLEAEAAKKLRESLILARQEREKAAKEKERREAETAKKVRESLIQARQAADKAAKEKARQEAEDAKKARESVIYARQQAAKTAKETALREAIAARKDKESAMLARREAEKAVKEKALQEAAAAKKAKETAMLARREAEKAEKEKALQEAAAAKKAKETAMLARREAEKAEKEKALQVEAVAKKARETSVLARREAEKAEKEKARQEAEAAKKIKETAVLAKKEAEKAAKEKARQQVEAAKKMKQAALLAKKEAAKLDEEQMKQEAEAIERAKAAAIEMKKRAEETSRILRETAVLVQMETEKTNRMKAGQDTDIPKDVNSDATLAVKEAEQTIKEMEMRELQTRQERAGQQSMGIVEAPAPVTRPRSGEKPPTRIVPLFSKKSIAVIVIGLVLGLGIGLVYYLVSPSFMAQNNTSTTDAQKVGGLAAMLGQVPDSPWSSSTMVQVVNSTSSPMTLEQLNMVSKSYSVSLKTMTFLNYLKEQIDLQAPQYSTDVSTLQGMIQVKDMTLTNHGTPVDVPSFEITVTAPTSEETAYISDLIPKAFQNFLVSQANETLQVQYQETQSQMDTLQAAANEAFAHLNDMKQQAAAQKNAKIQQQVTLNSQVKALQAQLDGQALTLSTMGTPQDMSAELKAYGGTLQEQEQGVRNALTQAQLVLNAMNLQYTNNAVTNDPNYIMLNAKIVALQAQLAAQANALALIIANGDSTGERIIAAQLALTNIALALSDAQKELAALQLQASLNQEPASKDYLGAQAEVLKLNKLLSNVLQAENYANLQASFDATSTALGKASQEVAQLTNDINNNNIENSEEYVTAQSKLDTLNAQITQLHQQLSTAMVDTGSSQIASLALASTTDPLPVPPARAKAKNALMLGAVIGVIGGWMILNRRWVSKGLSSNQNQ